MTIPLKDFISKTQGRNAYGRKEEQQSLGSNTYGKGRETYRHRGLIIHTQKRKALVDYQIERVTNKGGKSPEKLTN